MTIATLCRREVVTIHAGASLREAAVLMREHHVGALVVTVQGAGHEEVIGLVTDRDMALEILALRLDPSDVKVGQLASRNLASVPETAGITEAVSIMREAGVRRLLVTEREGRLAGFVSADDLLEALAAQLSTLAAALRGGIAREGAQRPPIPPTPVRPVFLPHGTPGMQQPIGLP